MNVKILILLLLFLPLHPIYAIYAKTHDLQRALQEKNVHPVVVIGSGPAGLTAGMYAARSGMPTRVYAGETTGGQLTETSYVDNYSGVKRIVGFDLMQIMAEQAVAFGAEIIEETIVSVDLGRWPFVLHTSRNEEVRALSLIIATGANPRKLGVVGEEEYWGSGVSSCPICDGIFFSEKEVVVVGGGDSAIEKAIQLSSHAKKITILVRSHAMKASEHMKKKLKTYSNIEPVQYHKEITKIVGDGHILTGVRVVDRLTNKKKLFPTDGLFLAIGHIPNTALFRDQLELTEEGFIAVKNGPFTSVPGVFAAGEVMDAKYRQAIISAGYGSMAALEATHWLQEIGLANTHE